MLVFVYGTLRRGGGNHRLLEGASFEGAARTLPAFTMVTLGSYPGVFAGGDTAIVGELYEVDQETLDRLDLLESHPRFYQRTRVKLDGGRVAHVYLLPRARYSGRTVVPGGDWMPWESAMRIEMDDRMFEGTAKQIVQAMRSLAEMHPEVSLDAYVDAVARRLDLTGVRVDVEGQSTEERCQALVDELLRAGIAREVTVS